ncbi:MAG: HDOD domain-containing protein [Nitrospira sp.]|nr:HDOD domain-containing protein [Nitrospira sp.]
MPSSNAASESVFIDSIRPRLHQNLRPLFDESSRCLPILESTCQQILNHMGPQSNAVNLAQVISRDHGLTCKVLQVANSIAYSPQQTIVSVPHAVSWLGLDTVRSLVAAAHLVEQLQHWPVRQHEFRTLIAKSLLSATYAGELGMAIGYSQPGQLFTGALLYSIGDLAIAYQDPDLFLALQAISKKSKRPSECALQETRLIGIPRLTLAQALAQMWNLPDDLIELFRHPEELAMGHWQSGLQTYRGVVAGSIRLVEVLTGPASQTAIEEAKKTLQLGSRLSSGLFAELTIRAMDRGRQLIRSMGLAIDSSHEAMAPPPKEDATESLSHPPPIKGTLGKEQATLPPREESVAPVLAKPLETLQAFQDSLQAASDLNGLLGAFVQSLHRDAGFDRIGLALLNQNDSDLLVGRLVLGVAPPTPYLRSLSGSLSREHQFFLTVLKRADPFLVPNFLDRKAGILKHDFIEVWRPTSAIMAPLRVGAKPIGLIFCDRATTNQPVLSQDCQVFRLFFAQTTLGLNRLAGIL